MRPPKKQIKITIAKSNPAEALKEHIQSVLHVYGYRKHEAPMFLSCDTWSKTYSIVLHSPIKQEK